MYASKFLRLSVYTDHDLVRCVIPWSSSASSSEKFQSLRMRSVLFSRPYTYPLLRPVSHMPPTPCISFENQKKHAEAHQRAPGGTVEKSRVVVVSNRLPISAHRDTKSGEWKFRMSSGGLVTALQGVRHEMDFVWIGWLGVEVHESEQVFRTSLACWLGKTRTIFSLSVHFIPFFSFSLFLFSLFPPFFSFLSFFPFSSTACETISSDFWRLLLSTEILFRKVPSLPT